MMDTEIMVIHPTCCIVGHYWTEWLCMQWKVDWWVGNRYICLSFPLLVLFFCCSWLFLHIFWSYTKGSSNSPKFLLILFIINCSTVPTEKHHVKSSFSFLMLVLIFHDLLEIHYRSKNTIYMISQKNKLQTIQSYFTKRRHQNELR